MPEIKVGGMRCEHCREAVRKALSAVEGVAEARVDLAAGLALWRDKDEARPVQAERVRELIRELGFEA